MLLLLVLFLHVSAAQQISSQYRNSLSFAAFSALQCLTPSVCSTYAIRTPRRRTRRPARREDRVGFAARAARSGRGSDVRRRRDVELLHPDHADGTRGRDAARATRRGLGPLGTRTGTVCRRVPLEHRRLLHLGGGADARDVQARAEVAGYRG